MKNDEKDQKIASHSRALKSGSMTPLSPNNIDFESSCTQKLEDSSNEISPNSSGVMLIDQFNEIKRLFDIQGRELENVGRAFTSSSINANKMREIIKSIDLNPPASQMDSLYDHKRNFNDSQKMISPVSIEEPSFFASSLMSMEDYQVEKSAEKSSFSILVKFLVKKWKRLEVGKKFFFFSHVPAINL